MSVLARARVEAAAVEQMRRRVAVPVHEAHRGPQVVEERVDVVALVDRGAGELDGVLRRERALVRIVVAGLDPRRDAVQVAQALPDLGGRVLPHLILGGLHHEGLEVVVAEKVGRTQVE
jgi:hypothetical protein